MTDVIELSAVSFRYGRTMVLRDVSAAIPAGVVYALLGPNGAGKTTLMHLLMGLVRPASGRVTVLGREPRRLTPAERAGIGYVAEGQQLPRSLTLAHIEAYLAPLYPTWDSALAADLAHRFRLDRSRTIGQLSRGEVMKAALLCALAPRPRLLLMDEPFSGMDAAVKDELVYGMLESAGSEGWSVVISSHDLTELESLADWVGFLDGGRLRVSGSMDSLRDRFRRVDLTGVRPADIQYPARGAPLAVEHAGTQMSLLFRGDQPLDDAGLVASLELPETAHATVRPATLREIFIGLAREDQPSAGREAAAGIQEVGA